MIHFLLAPKGTDQICTPSLSKEEVIPFFARQCAVQGRFVTVGWAYTPA